MQLPRKHPNSDKLLQEKICRYFSLNFSKTIFAKFILGGSLLKIYIIE